VKYAFMAENLGKYELEIMARVFNVTVKAYQQWKTRGESQRKQEDALLTNKIKVIHAKSNQTYGSKRIKSELLDEGKRVSRGRVNRLMRQAGLETKYKRKYVVTTKSNHDYGYAPNVLNREFQAQKPNQKWVSDITYLPTTEGWLYMATVMDLFSRRIIGWAFSTSLETDIVLKALNMAKQQRKPSMEDKLIYHSDRGVQYASLEFKQALAKLKATSSMSRKGNCWDNAVMESFYATLKLELDLEKYPIGTREVTKAKVFYWLEGWYNRERRHSSLGYLSPAKFEQKFYSQL